jgi:hypothetical protein
MTKASTLRQRSSLIRRQAADRTAKGDRGPNKGTVALRIAEEMGLLTGPKSKHFNAKVTPLLFQAAAKRIGSTSPAVVISAALAALATEDELGKWLASRWGSLADADTELLKQIDL